MKVRFALALALVVMVCAGLLLTAGCGQPSPEELRKQLKSDLEHLKASLSTLLTPSTFTSSSGFDAARKEVQDAYSKSIEDARKLKDLNVSNFQKAWEELNSAITSDVPLQEKVDRIQSAVTSFQDAWDQLMKSING